MDPIIHEDADKLEDYMLEICESCGHIHLLCNCDLRDKHCPLCGSMKVICDCCNIDIPF